MSMKIGFALGAGGSRGVCHIGAIKALEEAGIKPDYISGCSMGAVVGACYAKGMTVDEMFAAISELTAFQLVDINAAFISKLSLLRGNKMFKLILSKLGDVDFDELKIPFCCIASDLYSGRSVTLSEGKVATAVRASSSIPTVFQPVKLDGKLLVDGGVLCRVPTVQVRDMGADVVVAVDALVNTEESVTDVKNVFTMIMRIFDMMDYNATKMKKKLDKKPREIWIEPEMKGLSQYEVKGFDKAFEEGYLAAKAKIPAIKKYLES